MIFIYQKQDTLLLLTGQTSGFSHLTSLRKFQYICTRNFIDVGELERLGGLDHKMPWKSVFALIKDTEMRLHNSLLSVPLGCLWMQKWWSGRGRLLSTTKWPSLGRIQIYFTLQLSPFYTYLNLDMPCSDEFCPGAILPGGAIAPPAPPSPTSMPVEVVFSWQSLEDSKL